MAGVAARVLCGSLRESFARSTALSSRSICTTHKRKKSQQSSFTALIIPPAVYPAQFRAGNSTDYSTATQLTLAVTQWLTQSLVLVVVLTVILIMKVIGHRVAHWLGHWLNGMSLVSESLTQWVSVSDCWLGRLRDFDCESDLINVIVIYWLWLVTLFVSCICKPACLTLSVTHKNLPIVSTWESESHTDWHSPISKSKRKSNQFNILVVIYNN